MNIDQLKTKLKSLIKFKNRITTKSIIRKKLNKEIRELKKELSKLYNMTDEKIKLINKIKKIEPNLHIDLRKFTIKELSIHLKKIQEKREK